MVIEDVQVRHYLDAVVDCMTKRLRIDATVISSRMANDSEYIEELFSEDPEVLLHDDPMRLAKSFAVRWKLIEKPKLVIHRPQ